MVHHSRLLKFIVDVADADHDRTLAFWAAATGTEPTRSPRFPEYHWLSRPDQEPFLWFQRLDQGTSRVHLDIHTDDLDAEVTRLEHLGARRVRQVNFWWIMEDPAGLPFCVILDPSLDATNAQRWD